MTWQLIQNCEEKWYIIRLGKGRPQYMGPGGYVMREPFFFIDKFFAVKTMENYAGKEITIHVLGK
jgi:hypothetical protein